MIYRAIRSLLFRMDAEDAHEFASRQMEALQEIESVRRAIASFCSPPPSARTQLLGLSFPSPIGIAAGFDKNARLVPFLAAAGFGFIEVGTVTPRPQPGNPRPRLFRYPDDRALINRMGFNNDGANAVAARLRGARLSSPAPIFVNIGKNKETPLDRATEDYVSCYQTLAQHADAVVLNLSSPNTPGLRDLQRPEQLEALIAAIDRRGPILVKIAPDLDDAQLAEVADVCARRADGMICTNTTLDRLPGMNESGGLSGAPLRKKATDVLRRVRARVGPAYPLIGVGGVFTADDAREKFAAGANLVQLYTSFIYEGPLLARRLNGSLSR